MNRYCKGPCIICESEVIRLRWRVGLWWRIIIPKHLAENGGRRLDIGWGGKEFVGIG